MEPIVIEARDGVMISIEIDVSGQRPTIHIDDPHVRAEDQVEVFINGVNYSPDKF